ALMGARTFDGVSVATVQGREWELFDACRVAQLLEAYKRLMEQNPPTADAYDNAAQIATRLGRPSDLEAAWNRLTTDFPDDALTRRMALERPPAAFKRRSWRHGTPRSRTTRPSPRAVRIRRCATGRASAPRGQGPPQQAGLGNDARAVTAIGARIRACGALRRHADGCGSGRQ